MSTKERGRPTKVGRSITPRQQAERERAYASVKRALPATHVSPAGTAAKRAYDARLNVDPLVRAMNSPLGSKPTHGK